jgi:hypothetical protein
MTIDVPTEDLDLSRIPDGLRVGGRSGPLLGLHGGIGNLPGTWTGRGFNLIWRPHFPSAQGDHFLQLNLTSETMEFASIGGPVPNRGLDEPDIAIFAIRYLQQIHDANFAVPLGGGGLHVEPGFWLSIPATAETSGVRTLVRAASIPHGTTVLAQGSSIEQLPPVIPPVSTVPFDTASGQLFPFQSESILSSASSFRTTPLPSDITQELVDNPNILLTDANVEAAAEGFTIIDSLEIDVSASAVTAAGQASLGAIGNIPFLVPNAEVANLSASFWLERVRNSAGASFLQLQYSQTVVLNFNGLSWPHVTVGNLVKSV